MAVRIPIKTEGGQQAADELKRVGDAGQSALDRINRASKEPATGLKALNSASAEVRRGLDDLGGRAGVVGRILSDIGPVGLAAGAALGVVTLGISEMVAEADKAERARLKITALLRTTQSASGQTYESISALADEIEMSTLATGDAVEAAAAKLLTFKSVSGDAFGGTLKIAQDMAAVFGGDVSSAITQLGKALEDPERGLTALSKNGISFTETQSEMIKGMVEMGDQTRAISEILKILESQIGGAGEAEAGTLTGAFHALAAAIGRVMEEAGKRLPLEELAKLIKAAANGMVEGDRAVFKSLEQQIIDRTEDLNEARARLEGLLSGKIKTIEGPLLAAQTKEDIDALVLELNLLNDRARVLEHEAKVAEKAAQANRIAATEDAITAKMREESEKRMDELQKERDANLKKEAAEQDRVSKARAAAVASIDGQIDSLENEQKALALAERERAIFVELLKAEETARKAGITVTNEQREAIIRETGALFDQKKAIDDKKKADEEATREAERAAKERERIAEREAEAMMKPFEHAAEGIQDAFTGAFESIFSGNVRNFADFADQVRGVFTRLAAEIATLLVFNPRATLGSVIGGVGLFGSGTASAGGQLVAGSTPGLSINPLSAFSNFLGPAGSLLGIGALGGGLIGKLTGGNTLGSSIGGALGAYGGVLAGSGVLGGATGALVGTLGQLGNFVIPGLGLALGALAGGLIGKKKPSNASAFGILDLGSGSRLQAPAERNSTDATRGARDAIVDAVLKLREGVVAATGGRITGRIGLDVGQRDGVQVSGIGAGRYGTGEQAVQAIFRGMLNNLQGVDAQFRQVFARLDTSNLEQAVADLGVAAGIIRKDYVQSEPLNAAAQAIKNLNDAFKPLLDNAQRLGLSLAPINAELARQRAKLTSDFNAEIDRAILGITDPLAAALADFDRVAADRLSNARTLGADLVDVERLTALERARIVEQYGQQANGALFQANQSIEQFLTGLRTGGAYLSPAATLANAESEFSRLLGLAQGGDVAARGSLSGAAGALLNASREAWGSSEMFFQRLNFVESSLGNLIGQGSGTTMFDNLGVTIAQGNSSLEYQLVQLNNKVAELTAVVADQQASLARLAAA